MKKTKKALASLAIAGMVLSMAPMSVFAADSTATDRIFGADRIETAVKVAQAGWTTATTVVVAPAADANLVDALAAAPLAGQEKAPILLTDGAMLDAKTKQAIVDLKATKVYAVGALSDQVVKDLQGITGVTVEALKGADRIETATKIVAKLSAPAGSFVVGYNALADALSVASFAAANHYSILVANPDGSLPTSETAVGTKYVVGGSTLVADVAGATRLAGLDRFETNQKVLNALNYNYSKVYVANGEDTHLVDSLVASSLASNDKAAIVLGDTMGAKAAADVSAKLSASSKVIALGGTSVVPDSVKSSVAYKVPATLAVESVNAINAKQIEVVFNKAVDETSAETPDNYIVNNVKLTNSSTFELQDDDQTVVITLADGKEFVNDDTYVIQVDPVQAKDDASTEAATYVKTVVFSDTTAPTVTSISSKTNTDEASVVTVEFSEPVYTGTIKIDGTGYSVVAGSTSQDITVNSGKELSVTGTHTLEAINLTDYAKDDANIADYASLTFTVTKDDVAPTVAISQYSDQVLLLTFDKKMDVNTLQVSVTDEANASVTSGAIVAKPGDDSKKLFLVPITGAGLYDNKDSRTLTVGFPADQLEDTLGNYMASTSKYVTLTKDVTAPTVTDISYTKDSAGKLTNIIVKFSEPLKANATLDVSKLYITDKDGKLVSNLVAGPVNVAQYATKVTVPVNAAYTPNPVDNKFTIVVPSSWVKDASVKGNGNSAYTKTLDLTDSASSTDFTFEGGNVSDSTTSGAITVTYPEAVKGGAVAGSATDPNNYSINGTVLPSGTKISIDPNDSKVVNIVLPSSFITADDAAATFRISNVKNTDGTVIKPVVETIKVWDTVKPKLTAAKLLDISTFELTFNEDMLVGNSNVTSQFTIKQGTNVISGATLTAALVSGDETRVRVSVSGVTLDLNKTYTITTTDSTNLTALTDSSYNNNHLSSDVTVTFTK